MGTYRRGAGGDSTTDVLPSQSLVAGVRGKDTGLPRVIVYSASAVNIAVDAGIIIGINV